MNSPSDDKAFDEYLGRRSPVSQNYRGLPSDEVPADLDRQILAQARAAIVGAGADELSRVRAKRRRLMQWTVPAAIAASALLVVSIVIRSGVEHEVTTADFSPAAKQAPQKVSGVAAAKPEAAGASAEESVVMIAPPRDAVTEFSSYARTPPARSDVQDKRSYNVPQVPAIEPTQVAASAPAPAAVPPPPPAMEMHEPTRATAAAREQETDRVLTSRRQEAAKELAAAGALSRTSGISESANAADAALNVARLHENPEDWLEHIRELRRDGQDAAADREWKQFQETYPDHPVAETDVARAKQDSR